MRILTDEDQNLPYFHPPYLWEKNWTQPQPSNIAATLGPRPGNILRPPPNHYNLYTWTPKDERAAIPPYNIQDFEKNVEFFTLENANAKEPEVIAGINLKEIVTKKPEDVEMTPA